MALERLQKILAAAGVASRRAAEELITAGRVRVDGRIVRELGAKADPRRNKVELDGNLVLAEDLVYVVLHKPRAVVCTMSDPEGRDTVTNYLGQVQGRVVPVGRLDYHTSGVLLLTNDGEFAEQLTHPSKHCLKVYVAKVQGIVDDAQVEAWCQPIEIDGKVTRGAEARRLRVEGEKTWLEISLREGKNRQIHRIGETVGNRVLRLARLAFGGVTTEGLRPGQWRYLSKEELTQLKSTYGVPKRIRPAPALPNIKQIRKGRASEKGKRGVRAVSGDEPWENRSRAKRSLTDSNQRRATNRAADAGPSSGRTGAGRAASAGSRGATGRRGAMAPQAGATASGSGSLGRRGKRR